MRAMCTPIFEGFAAQTLTAKILAAFEKHLQPLAELRALMKFYQILTVLTFLVIAMSILNVCV
jgi:hypothetical protein